MTFYWMSNVDAWILGTERNSSAKNYNDLLALILFQSYAMYFFHQTHKVNFLGIFLAAIVKVAVEIQMIRKTP